MWIPQRSTLESGLATPVEISKQWLLVIIDLKECFTAYSFILRIVNALHFSSQLLQGPHVLISMDCLHQGMNNSPTMCQYFFDLVFIILRLFDPFLTGSVLQLQPIHQSTMCVWWPLLCQSNFHLFCTYCLSVLYITSLFYAYYTVILFYFLTLFTHHRIVVFPI